MRNLLALIGLIVVGFAAIGWYCGWYKLTVTRDKGGPPEIKTTVNPDKVVDDSTSFFKRLEQIATERARSADPKQQPPSTPGTTPGPIAPVKGESPEKSNLGGTVRP